MVRGPVMDYGRFTIVNNFGYGVKMQVAGTVPFGGGGIVPTCPPPILSLRHRPHVDLRTDYTSMPNSLILR